MDTFFFFFIRLHTINKPIDSYNYDGITFFLSLLIIDNIPTSKTRVTEVWILYFTSKS